MTLRPVDESVEMSDPYEYMLPEEFEAEFERQEKLLPAPTNAAVKLTSVDVPVIRHPRRKGGHIEDVDSYIRHIDVGSKVRAEIDKQSLTPAGGEVEDQDVLGLIKQGTDGLNARADEYAQKVWGYEPGSQASLSQQTDVAAMLAKHDNVKALGARITEMAADDPELKSWLTENVDPAWEAMRVAGTGTSRTSPYDSWWTTVNGDLREGQLQQPEDPVEAAALYYAALAQYAWAEDSTDSESGLSQAMQASASKLFGVQDDVTIGDFGDADTPFSDAYVRATYERTQRQLKAAGISKVTLFRGMAWEEPPPDWVTQAMDTGDITPGGEALAVADATMNPLSSWSVSQQTAVHFTRLMSEVIHARLGAEVPASRILSMPFSGPGCLSESEFIVLGSGTVQVTVS